VVVNHAKKDNAIAVLVKIVIAAVVLARLNLAIFLMDYRI
jgi:hypothetical protein